ncbi:hypothetical protein TTRE_0000564901 [Trichuris trichiura]|uniref:Uncharacterized protein n=1 Tax=Trichuris trichiura TaxID=36087 RepID=A0A077ZCS9_TRITR|nr:hypothetical protein TTRE_0000564901 [Trichuris trichiura]
MSTNEQKSSFCVTFSSLACLNEKYETNCFQVVGEPEVDVSAPFPYQAKITLFALMACFIICNPAQLLGNSWSRQFTRTFDFSRFFSSIIGNNVYRILLLLVVNLLVVIFVMTKLCWRVSSPESAKHLWSSCIEAKKSADEYLRVGDAKAALQCLINCATTLQAINGRNNLYELIRALLLPAGGCQVDSKNSDWKVQLVKSAVEELRLKDGWKNTPLKEADLAKYRLIYRFCPFGQQENFSSLENICLLALRAKLAASTGDIFETRSVILNWCERCAGSVHTVIPDDKTEELFQCLAVQWCIEACLLLIRAEQQKAYSCGATSFDSLLKKTISKLVKIERCQASRHPFLADKLSCHEKLKVLLESGNPVKAKYTLVGSHPKERIANDGLSSHMQINLQERLSLVLSEALEFACINI